MAVGQRVTIRDVERELVANLPDKSDQPRNRLFDAELLLIKHLRDRPHFPLEWTFNDGTDKNIGMVMSRKQSFDIEMDRSPSARCETIPAQRAPTP